MRILDRLAMRKLSGCLVLGSRSVLLRAVVPFKRVCV